PFDTARDMGAAIDALRPRAIVFSKLDVWPELVHQARARGVRLGMISATLAAASGRRSTAANLLLGDAYTKLDAVGAIDRADADLLLVDRFGLLGDLYALGDIAFVGAGFHAAALHSVLEPAAYAQPVLFGPQHTRSRDALLLLRSNGARAVASATEIAASILA